MSWETVLIPSTSVWELILRGTAIYLAVFAFMRIAGRREAGEMNTADLILVLLISEAASVGIGGEAHSILDSLITVVTIIAWSIVLDAIGYRWKWAAKLLKPQPRPLINEGVLNVQTARRELLTRDEIRSELRKQGITEISEVYRAYVEPTGAISVLKHP